MTMTLKQMADELQAIIDGERPRLNKTEMREYVRDLLDASAAHLTQTAQVDADYMPGELDRTAPERIWLQIDTDGDNSQRSEPWPGAEGVTWQDESIGGLEIEYVRADLAHHADTIEMSPEFTDSARGAIAWVLYHHQGGKSPIGEPLRFALGMGSGEPLPDHLIAEAKRYAQWANPTSESFLTDIELDPRDLRTDSWPENKGGMKVGVPTGIRVEHVPQPTQEQGHRLARYPSDACTRGWRVKTKDFVHHNRQSCRLGRHEWSVARLVQLSHDLPIMVVPLNHLNVYYTYRNLTLRDMVMHMKAVEAADLGFPIILDEDGELMDGRHRIMKAMLREHPTILAVRFDENPTPDKYHDKEADD